MKPNNIICFKENTTISTPDGDKFIQDINVYDQISSFNQESKSKEIVSVERIAYSYHTEIIKMTFDDSTIIEMTPDHPIWIYKKGWAALRKNDKYNLNTKKIEVGDKCLSINNNNQIVYKKIDCITVLQGYFKMFIISGGNHHNFFANGILVHDENLLELDLIEEGINYCESKSAANNVYKK